LKVSFHFYSHCYILYSLLLREREREWESESERGRVRERVRESLEKPPRFVDFASLLQSSLQVDDLLSPVDRVRE
jgi:hypothetical protein